MDNTGGNFADFAGYPGSYTTDYSQLIQTYYTDLTYLADTLAKLTGTYNLMVSSADGFNRIALAKKKDVRHALSRASALGNIIDSLIDMLETQTELYMNYARIKDEFILSNMPHNEIIKSDIEHHIKHEHHEHHDND